LDKTSSGNIGKAVRHLEWALRVTAKFIAKDIEAVNCHTLTVLPLGVLFKLLKGCILIYDPHELETETAGSVESGSGCRGGWNVFLIPAADATVVVNESIAEWYRARYDLQTLFVIRNFPEITPPADRPPLLRELLGLHENDLLFLYLGLLDAGPRHRSASGGFFPLERQAHSLFRVWSLKKDVEEKSKKFNNIKYLDAVPPNEVIDCARQADVGVSLIEDLCLSYHYALPNKIFEYISAGLPVIVSDLPKWRI
jgi:glycosyltransferase involved in cell wall biosynthesis